MLKKILSFFIILYQKIISPALPDACRFYPSCSEYALDAIEAHGSLVGLWKSMCRLLRCHPFSAGGFDPVLDEKEISASRAGTK